MLTQGEKIIMPEVDENEAELVAEHDKVVLENLIDPFPEIPDIEHEYGSRFI